MQLHEIRPIHKFKKSKRIGRGGKKGTYCGRGIKGQKARTGKRLKPIIRELIKKYPKLRGYRQNTKFKTPRSEIAVLSLEKLEKIFNPGEAINPEILIERRIVRRIKGRTPAVKILGKKEIKKALAVEGFKLSKNAKEKIEKAGGTIK